VVINSLNHNIESIENFSSKHSEKIFIKLKKLVKQSVMYSAVIN